MVESQYPLNLADLDNWRKSQQVSLDEARKRFVQYVTLQSIALSSDLWNQISFKGGNALRFVYQSTRSTVDLDFTADSSLPDDEDTIRSALDRALRIGHNRFGIKLKCQRVKRKPPKTKGTLPTYDIGIAYQFPGDRYFHEFENPDRNIMTVTKLEISFNDLVCETVDVQLGPDIEAKLRVCSLEDILAEKLRALLQQVIRNRSRPQDVLDIARMMTLHRKIVDLEKVAAFLIQKSKAREISATKLAFRHEEVRSRASTDYEEILAVSQEAIIPFEDAWQAVQSLVANLDIPDE